MKLGSQTQQMRAHLAVGEAPHNLTWSYYRSFGPPPGVWIRARL